ncbi:MAG: hypothetical protein ACK521_08860 [bacterium]
MAEKKIQYKHFKKIQEEQNKPEVVQIQKDSTIITGNSALNK